MVNIKYSNFLQEMQKKKESTKLKESKINSSFNMKDENTEGKNKINEKIDETEEVFKKSLNFGILIFSK